MSYYEKRILKADLRSVLKGKDIEDEKFILDVFDLFLQKGKYMDFANFLMVAHAFSE